jgi:hypothetical protein
MRQWGTCLIIDDAVSGLTEYDVTWVILGQELTENNLRKSRIRSQRWQRGRVAVYRFAGSSLQTL